MRAGWLLSTALLLAAALAPSPGHAATSPVAAASPTATDKASAEGTETSTPLPAADAPLQGIAAQATSPARTGHNAHDHGAAISHGTRAPAAHDHSAQTPLPKTAQKPHRPSLKEKLEQTEQALSSEQDNQKAQSLMKKAETLRLFTVQNGGRLLLSAAQDALRQGHTDEAEKTLSAAVTLQPDNAFLRRQRAAIRLIGNDFTGAVEDLQLALVQDPGDAQSWDLLARTQEHLHHPGQALHAYTEALTHAPLLPGGQARYRQLEQQAHGRPD